MEIPREYNAAVDLIGRNLAAGRGGKVAYIDDTGSLHLCAARRARRPCGERAARPWASRARTASPSRCSTRADWAALFLGAIKAGIVPVALNTLLTPADYEYQLKDSRAKAVFVSEPLLKNFDGIWRSFPPKSCARIRSSRNCSPLAIPKAEAAPRCATTCASGSTRRARPARRRARCTCTRTSSSPPSSTPCRCSASASPTWCSPRRSSSSPTAWATR